MSDDREDSELIDRILAGDVRAFEALLDRYERVIYNLAFRMTGCREDAQDVAQGVFVRVYENLTSFDRRNRFFSWIYRIAINQCLNFKRSRRATEPAGDQEADPRDGPDASAERNEVAERIEEALMQIPTGYREVIVLRHFVNLSHEEIGEVLGVPAKTVKSRLHTGRNLLGAILAKQGLGTA